MLGIVIPAHNEQDCIEASVTAAVIAANHPNLLGERGVVIVIADACRDRTAELASSCGATVIEVDNKNVGASRAIGAAAAIALGARWLAFTDADTIVAPDWLTCQLSCAADAVCGTVSVSVWPTKAEIARTCFLRSYRDEDGHSHIHGANFGVRTSAYLAAGGFQDLTVHEDVALVRALEGTGAMICWSALPRVETSARLHSRTVAGFGATLCGWNDGLFAA